MGWTFTAGDVATAARLDSITPSALSDSGLIRIVPVANTPTSVAVKFTAPFTAVPKVVVAPNTTVVGSTVKGVGVTDVTTTGFTAWVYRTNTTGTYVHWQAWLDQPSPYVTGQPVPATALDLISKAPMVTKSGSLTITPTANAPTSAAVTFPAAFSGTPRVLVTARTDVPGSQVLWTAVTDATASGFKAWVYRTNTTATVVNWVALGRLP